jgi:hypothetical protein
MQLDYAKDFLIPTSGRERRAEWLLAPISRKTLFLGRDTLTAVSSR